MAKPTMEQVKDVIRRFEDRRGKELTQDELTIILRKLNPEITDFEIRQLFPGGYKGLDGFIADIETATPASPPKEQAAAPVKVTSDPAPASGINSSDKAEKTTAEEDLKEKQKNQLAEMKLAAQTLLDEPKVSMQTLWSGVVTDELRHVKAGINLCPRSNQQVREAKMLVKVAVTSTTASVTSLQMELLAKSEEAAAQVVSLVQELIFDVLAMEDFKDQESGKALIVRSEGSVVVLTLQLKDESSYIPREEEVPLQAILSSVKKLEGNLAFGFTFDDFLAEPDKALVDWREALQLFLFFDIIPRRGLSQKAGVSKNAGYGMVLQTILCAAAVNLSANIEYDETKIWPFLEAAGAGEKLAEMGFSTDIKCPAGIREEVRKRWNDEAMFEAMDEEERSRTTRIARLVKRISDGLVGVNSVSFTAVQMAETETDEEGTRPNLSGVMVEAKFENFRPFPLISYILAPLDDTQPVPNPAVVSDVVAVEPRTRQRCFMQFQKYAKRTGGNDSIDVADLQSFCKEMDLWVDEKDVQLAIKELSSKGGDTIDFEDFLKFWTATTNYEAVALQMMKLRMGSLASQGELSLMPHFPEATPENSFFCRMTQTICARSDKLKMGVDVWYEAENLEAGAGGEKKKGGGLKNLKGKFKNVTKGIVAQKRLGLAVDAKKQAMGKLKEMRKGAKKGVKEKAAELRALAEKGRKAMEEKKKADEEGTDKNWEMKEEEAEGPDEGMTGELVLSCGEDAKDVVEIINKDLKQFLVDEMNIPVDEEGMPKFRAKQIGDETVGVKFSGMPSMIPMAEVIKKLDMKLGLGVRLGLTFEELAKKPQSSLLFELLDGVKIQVGGETLNASKMASVLQETMGMDLPQGMVDNIPLTGVDICNHAAWNKDAKMSSAMEFLSTFDNFTSFIGLQTILATVVQKKKEEWGDSFPVDLVKKAAALFHRATMRIDTIDYINVRDSNLDKPLNIYLKNTGRTSFLRVLDQLVVNTYPSLGKHFETFLEEQREELRDFFHSKISSFMADLPPLLGEKFPEECINPNTLGPLKRNKEMYNNPELMLMLGQGLEDPFYRFVSANLNFQDKYLEKGLKQWVFDKPEDKDSKKSGTGAADMFGACKAGYEGIHAMIRAGEEVAYEHRRRTAQACEWNIVPYDDGIDKMPDRAARVIELYRQAKIMKEKWFDDFIEDVAVKAGGTPHIAPLKGFGRVAEKLSMRPDAGVPWDIVRAQVECEEMAPLSKALNLITQNPNVRVHAVNDRFARPKEGWCDVSLYFSFDDPTCGQVVAEVQLVHYKMMKVREEFGAHDAYNDDRFPMEVGFIHKLKSGKK